MPVWIELAGVPSAIVYVQDETCEKAKTKAEEGKGKQKRDKYKIRKQIHNSNNKINWKEIGIPHVSLPHQYIFSMVRASSFRGEIFPWVFIYNLFYFGLFRLNQWK